MADYSLDREVTIHLMLTEIEAVFLRDCTQNKLHEEYEESQETLTLRRGIFEALREALNEL
jgi:hypothetical protein